MARLPSFAVLYFVDFLTDDGEGFGIAEVKGRFPTFEEAEAYRVRRFGAEDESSRVVED